MADITMVCERLGRCCREVHVVAAGGECKELLVWMDREWDEEYTVHAVELHKDGERGIFSFRPSEERACDVGGATATIAMTEDAGQYLFEPGKALMKAGAFNMIAEHFGTAKVGRSTHYYIYKEGCRTSLEELRKYGKVFRIIRCSPLDKRSIKAAGKEFPHSEVTARNISMDTDTLRKKSGVTSGDDAHIFGLRSDSAGPVLLITKTTQLPE